PISTVCLGQAVAVSAVLLAAGEKGRRRALPHSRIVIHQPLSGYDGQASDIEIHVREAMHIRHRLDEIFAFHTGQDVETIRHDTERDRFMTATEAAAYGIVDEVIAPRKIDAA